MAVRLEVSGLAELVKTVRKRVDLLYGPRLKDGAIVLEPVESLDDLPRGVVDKQSPGFYRVEQEGEDHFFAYVVGPQSLKKFLAPTVRKLWEVRKNDSGKVEFKPEAPLAKTLGFFGLRACDIKALATTDRVYQGGSYQDEYYHQLRPKLFLVTATCHTPSSVCFCTSMGYGPKPDSFDLNITEVRQQGQKPYFLVEAGSDPGRAVLKELGLQDEGQFDQEIETVYESACRQIKKVMPQGDVAALIAKNLESAVWDEVASLCLSCANCTAVCPTCFCSSTYDVNDLNGEHSERWLRQDSCFTSDHSYLHGGSVRKSTKSRYRQWLSHKLSTWWQQFGTSGCVGCGRCVSWCPVGIDLTAVVKDLKDNP